MGFSFLPRLVTICRGLSSLRSAQQCCARVKPLSAMNSLPFRVRGLFLPPPRRTVFSGTLLVFDVRSSVLDYRGACNTRLPPQCVYSVSRGQLRRVPLAGPVINARRNSMCRTAFAVPKSTSTRGDRAELQREKNKRRSGQEFVTRRH